jgi:biopolymer transport protein ExbB
MAARQNGAGPNPKFLPKLEPTMFRARRFPSILTALIIAATPVSLLITPQTVLAQSSAAAKAEPATAKAPEVVAEAATIVRETVNNPYGLDALWKTGDIVAKGTLAILLLMSAGSWYVIATKLYEQIKLTKQGAAADSSFWSAGGVKQAIEGLDESSAYRSLASAGAAATELHKGLLGFIDLNTWVTLSIQRSIEKIQSQLQGGLAFLATVGSTAPFVGLFGTVWGIYHALTAIGIAGQASIDKVAGPVGEALIMTALGLAVAVPAVLGYNWLVRRNKTALENVRSFGSELHAVLLGAAAAANRDETSRVLHNIRAISA